MTAISAQDLDASGTRMLSQAISFLTHALLALLAWGTFMGGVTALYLTGTLHEASLSPLTILLCSFTVPLLAGLLTAKKWPSAVATLTWLAGMVWFMIVGLWVLDMPTGPGACFHCDASQKLWLTFFSLDQDSGMIDGQGRFLGTWPAVAMIGYAFGAKIALRNVKVAEEE